MHRLPLLLLLILLLPGCFIVVVDANGNNQNPFLGDGGVDAGLVRREAADPTRLAVATRMDYISRATERGYGEATGHPGRCP